MTRVAPRLRRVLVAPAAVLASLLLFPALAPTAAAALPAPVYGQGDVFVSAIGEVREYTPTGTLVRTLTTGTNDTFYGSAFDSSGNLLVTAPYGQKIVEFDPQGSYAGVVVDESQDFGSGPSSIAFATDGSFLDGSRFYGVLHRYLPPGTLVDADEVSYEATAHIALDSDQCTVYYTSGGTRVYAYDTCSDTQLPAVTYDLPNSGAEGIRELPDGDLLVADSDRVVLLTKQGRIVRTYKPGTKHASVYDLALDPDGTSFWVSDDQNGNLFRYRIADGALLAQFGTGSTQPYTDGFGVSVYDGRNVSTNGVPIVDAGPDVAGLSSDPIALHGSASDPEGDPLTIDWTASSPSCSFADPHSLDTTVSCMSNGTFTLFLSADDGHNPAQYDSTTITIGGGPCLGLTPTDGVTHSVNPKTGVTTFTGTPGNDVITGTPGPDVIRGGSGDDTICGGGGDDLVHGDAGADTISGGAGNDRLYGDADNDNIVGDGGNDTLTGGTGNDRLAGSGGTDSCDGGTGANIISSNCETTS